MKLYLRLSILLLIAALTVLPRSQANAAPAEALKQPGSVVVTFDPPIIDGLNHSEELYQLIIKTMNARENGLLERVKASGAMWSASHSLSGVQFSLFHFADPVIAATICKGFLNKLRLELGAELKKDKPGLEFADYIHAILEQEDSLSLPTRKPVSINFSDNMQEYVTELDLAASELFSAYQNSGDKTDREVLPGVLPTVYTIFGWPEITGRAFFTAKFMGEKFISRAEFDQLLKYEIIFGDSALNLVVYMSGSEELLADNIQKFRQIRSFELNHELPADWSQFSSALSQITADDRRDLAKSALFAGWLKHWQGSFDNLKIERPAAPAQINFGICMPTAQQHLVSFSSKLFPNFAAASRPDGDDTCDIAIAIGGDNLAIIDEIYNSFNSNPSAIVPLTLTREQNLLKIAFHSSPVELSGHLARLRNSIYNNLIEKGLLSDPVDTLQIGIAGVSSLPPFELRGLLQRGWSPIPNQKSSGQLPQTAHSQLLNISNSSAETLRQRWQLYLASSRGRSELLAIIAAAGYQIKDFNLPE